MDRRSDDEGAIRWCGNTRIGHLGIATPEGHRDWRHSPGQARG